MTKSLKKLYHTHGALTFLLAFYPLLPNIVELHTKGYLALTQRMTGAIQDIDAIIQIMFGTRGMKIYQQYKTHHPKQVLPNEIFDLLFNQNQPDTALKAIQKMFFDRYQRKFLHADKMRAAIILATPEILRQYPNSKYAQFRETLIRLLANQAVIDQGIPSQLAFIEVALRLLTQIERHKLQLEKEKIEQMFRLIEIKIKSELAGKASAFTAPMLPPVNAPKDPIIITKDQAANLHSVLLLMAISPAFEVRDDAKKAILEIEYLKKQTDN